ncbi:RnlB RNA ligase 2 [Ralstonia phage RSP15]|uniref:RNA ligase n=1 Tax=Ralstonia phage RSP15 TaxID=1785960 RepID=UPI00074D4B62|nr:RNA ligase [Ralstonia phage RSP15]BAU40117.1 RnlB RNA ligase 2 [Ralstonia phage RSP15]
MTFVKFPSIEQYKNVIRRVKDRAQYIGKDEEGKARFDKNLKAPKLKVRGYIKLHGSNAAIAYHVHEPEYIFQSREQVLDMGNTLNGFYIDMKQNIAFVDAAFAAVREVYGEEDESLILYGEWCGGSIQKGVALSQLTKRFVVFAIKKDDVWQDLEKIKYHNAFKNQIIQNIADFIQYELEIDFENPELSQNRLVEITNSVEKECPYGFSHGVSGIGEGVVWRVVEEGYNSSDYWFKVKGEKHSVTKNKTLAPVDEEKVKNVIEAVEKFATVNRIEQGITVLTDQGQDMTQSSNLGNLIKWVQNDIVKEEEGALIASGLSLKDIGSGVAKKVRTHFLQKVA